MIDVVFFVRFLTGFLVSVSMFFIVEFLIKIMDVKNHKQKSNLYLFALLSSFSIMLYVLFFFDIKRNGDSLVFLLPNMMGEVDIIFRKIIVDVAEGFRFFDLRLALLALLFTSFLVFVFLLLIPKLYIKRKYNFKPCKEKRVLSLLEKVYREYGKRMPETMMFHGDVNAFVFGVPPVLAISEELTRNVNEKELELVLRHEMNHIKNRDNILRPFLFSLQILFFYNPFVHILTQRITKEREFLADNVSNVKKERVAFLYTLVKLSELRGKNELLFPSFISSPLVKSNLKMRTETLLSEDRKCRGNPYLFFFWFFSILIFTGTYVSGNLPLRGSPREGGFMQRNDLMFFSHAPEKIFMEEGFPHKEFFRPIPDDFPPLAPMTEIEPVIPLGRRHKETFQDFPFRQDRAMMMLPTFYTIKIRIMLAAFLLLPLLFIFSHLVSHSLLKKKHIQWLH